MGKRNPQMNITSSLIYFSIPNTLYYNNTDVALTGLVTQQLKKIGKIQGIPVFRDFTIRDPRYFVILFQASIL